MIAAAIVVASLASSAHDTWANGSSVPRWVKSACCGPHDVHQLTLGQVSRERGGWRIDGLVRLVPDQRTFPSQDDYVWAFYWDGAGSEAVVNCLFVPVNF